MSLPDRTELRRLVVGLAVAAIALAGCAPAPAPSAPSAPSEGAAADEALVTVVHGLRGELVDVYLDGTLLLEGFKPDRLTDPMAVPIGSHTIDLRPAGTPATDAPKATATATLTPGPMSVVAHFAPGGGWTMSVFSNAVAPLGAGTGRVVFRNAAAVTPVAVTLRGGAAVPPIDIGKEAAENLPAASYAVAVGGTDGSTLLPDNDISVDSGAALILYLVGQDSNVTWLSQRIAASTSTPVAVQAGNSGLLGAGVPAPAWPALLMIAGGLGIAAGGVGREVLRRRRLVALARVA